MWIYCAQVICKSHVTIFHCTILDIVVFSANIGKFCTQSFFFVFSVFVLYSCQAFNCDLGRIFFTDDQTVWRYALVVYKWFGRLYRKYNGITSYIIELNDELFMAGLISPLQFMQSLVLSAIHMQNLIIISASMLQMRKSIRKVSRKSCVWIDKFPCYIQRQLRQKKMKKKKKLLPAYIHEKKS